MKITLAVDISKMDPKDPSFTLYVSKLLSDAVTVINGKVSFTDNCDSQLVKFTFTQTNADQAVMHTLGRVPQGFILVGSQAAGQVYNGSSTWTTNAIYLRATAATTCSLLLF